MSNSHSSTQKQDYPWKRFWCPRGYEATSLRSAFLPDPDEELLGPLNPEVVPFSALAGTPCLVLVGESGIGKSVEVRKEYSALTRQLQADSELALHFDLKEFTSGDLRLCLRRVPGWAGCQPRRGRNRIAQGEALGGRVKGEKP